MAAVAPNGRVLSPGEVLEDVPEPVASQEWQENLNIHMICPDCKEVPPNLVEEFSSGDTVCGSCGLVLGARIVDTRSEWRTFSNDDQGNDDPSRVGDAANPLLNGSQLQTNIAFGDGSGRARDLHRAQNKAGHDKSTKSLMAAYKQIGSLCEAHEYPHTVSEAAKHLFKMTEDSRQFRGKSTDAIIAGCIFIACRQLNVPRSFREVYELTKVSKKEIGRTFKMLQAFFAKETAKQGKENALGQGGLVMPSQQYQMTQSTDPAELCRRHSNQLMLSNQAGMVAADLAQRVVSEGSLDGRSPLSTAAACIYFISNLLDQAKTPKEIANVVNVSDGTIRTAYKYLYNDREKLVRPEWLQPPFKGDMARLPSA